MKPDWISPSSCSTFASGATQFVVHDAFETMWCAVRVVRVVVDAEHERDVGVGRGSGDDHLLRARVEVLLRALPVGEEPGRLEHDVDPEVAPRQRRRIALGEDLDLLPGRAEDAVAELDLPANGPRLESYLRRCAIVFASPRSFSATISMSEPSACWARKKFRPMRPNPLMPTRIPISLASVLGSWSGAESKRRPAPRVVAGGGASRPSWPAGRCGRRARAASRTGAGGGAPRPRGVGRGSFSRRPSATQPRGRPRAAAGPPRWCGRGSRDPRSRAGSPARASRRRPRAPRARGRPRPLPRARARDSIVVPALRVRDGVRRALGGRKCDALVARDVRRGRRPTRADAVRSSRCGERCVESEPPPRNAPRRYARAAARARDDAARRPLEGRVTPVENAGGDEGVERVVASPRRGAGSGSRGRRRGGGTSGSRSGCPTSRSSENARLAAAPLARSRCSDQSPRPCRCRLPAEWKSAESSASRSHSRSGAIRASSSRTSSDVVTGGRPRARAGGVLTPTPAEP